MTTPREAGFTLIEIAIVMLIIGLLLTGVLNSSKIIGNAQSQDLISAVQDLQAASVNFQAKYGFLPGDLPNARNAIPSVPAGCNGNGNGLIDTANESGCAIEELIGAGLIRGQMGKALTVENTLITLTSRQLAGGNFAARMPANWNNIIQIQTQGTSLNCENSVQMDKALDDGNVNTGNFITSTACGAAGVDMNPNTTVNYAALRLN